MTDPQGQTEREREHKSSPKIAHILRRTGILPQFLRQVCQCRKGNSVPQLNLL